MPINVAIVEDDPRVREGLLALLNGGDDFRCVGAFPNAEAALKQLPHDWPDVVLMDIRLPGMSGVECVAKLKELRPALQIIMVTICADDEQIFNSLKAGASGYLIKKAKPAEILEAITEVHSGGAPMSGAIARKVVECFRQSPAQETEGLSKRENEILGYLAKGYQNKEIAEALSLSVLTVSTHVRNIYDKLHVRSRTEAVVKFLGSQGKSGSRQD